RFVFSNPGNLLISRYQYYHSGGNSICRNKSLQQMFMLIGRAEKAGSGVDKILKGWEWAQWKKPYMEEFNRPDKVVLTLSTQSLLAPEIVETLRKQLGENFDQIGGDELKTLAYCLSEGYVTNEFLQFVVNLHPADITKMLRDLCEKEYLRSIGHGRGTRYYLNDDSSLSNDDSSLSNDDSSSSNDDSSLSNDDSSSSNDDSSSSNDDSSSSNDDSSSSNDDSPFTKSKRYKPAELDEIIAAACESPLSLDDLSQLLGKSRTYLINKVIPRMINKGLIKRVYPKSFPNQKYQRN
ncbi:MAG: ATP-binding protein, partial [Bacteroidales bacterium]